MVELDLKLNFGLMEARDLFFIECGPMTVTSSHYLHFHLMDWRMDGRETGHESGEKPLLSFFSL